MALLPEFLQRESIVPVRKLQDFTFLDRDQFLIDQNVEALARKAAKLNLPPKSAHQLDPNELTFVQELTQKAVAATMTLNDSLSSIKNSISKIDVEGEKAEVDTVVRKLEAELTKQHEEKMQEIKRLRDLAESRQSDLDRFKKDNGLLREPRYKKDGYLKTVATISFFLAIEIALNSSLLAKASAYGLVGGAIIAILISLINIIPGFTAGIWLFPKTNQKNTVKAAGWRLALGLALVGTLIFNLLVGHYREVLLKDPDNSSVLALTRFSEGMFNLSEIESIFLIIIGVIVACGSFWKGTTQNDPYPGYTVLAKASDSAKEYLAEEKQEALAELDAIGERYDQTLSSIHKKVSNDYSRYNNLNSAFYYEQKLYKAYVADLSQTAQIVLTMYRQTNESIRDGECPDYFKDKISVDFDQEPIVPELYDVGPSLNAVVENFGSRIPNLKIDFSKALEQFRNKIVEIDL